MALQKTLWQQFVDLVTTGQAASDQFDTAFSNIDDAIDQIDMNVIAITALQAKAPFVPTYDYIKESAITVTGDVYEEIARLTTSSRDAGIYKLTQSMLYTLNSTTTSAFFRFSIDGGVNWGEIRREPKDNLDTIPSAYTSTIVHSGGVFEVIIESKKENSGDILVVSTIDLIFERKV